MGGGALLLCVMLLRRMKRGEHTDEVYTADQPAITHRHPPLPTSPPPSVTLPDVCSANTDVKKIGRPRPAWLYRRPGRRPWGPMDGR